MRLQQINIEGFGALSQCRISGLSDMLTVIHGVNGAGKTTMMHFLSGVFCGYDEARRSRLIPSLKGGSSGGSLILQNRDGRFEVIRHARGEHPDTLAISLLQGVADDVVTLRKSLRNFPQKLWARLYSVTGYGAHDLAGLVQLAIDEGVDLGSRSKSAAWISARIRTMEIEREELFRSAPTQGTLVALEQKRNQLQEELEATRKLQLKQLESWQHSLKLLREEIENLTARGPWLDQELQAVETDLTECQDRLWSTRESVVQDVETVHRASPPVQADWLKKIAAIDREIAHVQQVLRDLAASRMTLSMSKADLAGAEIPDIESVLRQQRSSLSQIESQTEQLTAVISQLQNTSACICGPASERLQINVEAIREQVWLICQELGRQQATYEQTLLQTQREGVDRCEHELIKQIQRLRIRRDEVLHSRGRTTADRVHFRTLHEATGCQCLGHEEAIAEWQSPMESVPAQPQVIVRERTITTSNARPGDSALEKELLRRQARLRLEWANVTERLRAARIELHQLEWAAKEFAGDHSAQAIRNELTLTEQQLADAREQWQSLTLLETVLQRTQQKLNMETISTLISETSQYLDKMTEGRYPRVRWNASEKQLFVVNATEGELPAQALSRGTLEQAVLCFRLALCREFQRRGVDLPLVLDDVLTDSDEDRTRAAADVLEQFSKNHQVLFLTCQDHLADLLGSRDAVVISMPGSPQPIGSATRETKAASPASLVATPKELSPETTFNVEQKRVQPDEPYWLQSGSPLNYLPSLGEQMARRLGALGVRTIGDLVELDLDNSDMPLDSLQISPATLRNWQSEGLLLCCIPNLTGRDAQLLILCGIRTPEELSQTTVKFMLDQIEQLRQAKSGDYQTQWLTQRPEWPTAGQIERWIRSGRSARSWRAAREWSTDRKSHLRHQASRNRKRPLQPVLVSESPSTVRFQSQEEVSEWKFYLHHHSPIVDAPSIGPRMAERLNAIGTELVSHLLNQNAAEIAQRLNRREITADVVRSWQQQSHLMCSIPQMRGHDVQVLVACQVTDPEMLASMTPANLYARVEPFVNSREGVRLLRSSRVPDLAEVTDWIAFARKSPLAKAA